VSRFCLFICILLNDAVRNSLYVYIWTSNIVNDQVIWNNQLTRMWSLLFCGGTEDNYGKTKNDMCPSQ
jgi:hypothetical protein